MVEIIMERHLVTHVLAGLDKIAKGCFAAETEIDGKTIGKHGIVTAGVPARVLCDKVFDAPFAHFLQNGLRLAEAHIVFVARPVRSCVDSTCEGADALHRKEGLDGHPRKKTRHRRRVLSGLLQCFLAEIIGHILTQTLRHGMKFFTLVGGKRHPSNLSHG
jgi:hypothetical protein